MGTKNLYSPFTVSFAIKPLKAMPGWRSILLYGMSRFFCSLVMECFASKVKTITEHLEFGSFLVKQDFTFVSALKIMQMTDVIHKKS